MASDYTPTQADYESAIRLFEYISEGEMDDILTTALHRFEPIAERLRSAGNDLQRRFRAVHSHYKELIDHATNVKSKAENEMINATQASREQLRKVANDTLSIVADATGSGMEMLRLELDTHQQIWPVLKPFEHWIGKLDNVEDRPLDQRVRTGGFDAIWNLIGMIPGVGLVTNIIGLGKALKDMLHSTIPFSEGFDRHSKTADGSRDD